MEATGYCLLMLKKMSIQSKILWNKRLCTWLCLGNISKDFTINNMKKTRLKDL